MIRTWEHAGQYDRVVSAECFEHMRNYAELFRRIRGWLREDGVCSSMCLPTTAAPTPSI